MEALSNIVAMHNSHKLDKVHHSFLPMQALEENVLLLASTSWWINHQLAN
jgi:hypothetical protein